MGTIDWLKEQASIHEEPETDKADNEPVYSRPIGQWGSGEWGEFQGEPHLTIEEDPCTKYVNTISTISSSSEDETNMLKIRVDNLETEVDRPETELNELNQMVGSLKSKLDTLWIVNYENTTDLQQQIDKIKRED